MFKKWWVLLIQGILLCLLAILIFNNPLESLAGISIWFGILVLFTGVFGILGWIFAGKGERDTGSLIWSIISLLFGLLILNNILASALAVSVIFGIWVIILGFNLFSYGWIIKSSSGIGWILVLIGILSVIAGLMMVFNVFSGVTGAATIIGMEVLLSGIALIIFAFTKKSVVGNVKDALKSN